MPDPALMFALSVTPLVCPDCYEPLQRVTWDTTPPPVGLVLLYWTHTQADCKHSGTRWRQIVFNNKTDVVLRKVE